MKYSNYCGEYRLNCAGIFVTLYDYYTKERKGIAVFLLLPYTKERKGIAVFLLLPFFS